MVNGGKQGAGVVRLLPLVVVVVGVLAYANSFSNPFIFDDSYVVVNRPDHHRILPLRWGSRAVVDLTFKLNHAVGGLNVADYHATNMVIHIIAGLFLFGIVRLTLLSLYDPVFSNAPTAALTAAVAAAIWVAHPLQTESVTYVCQRYESMMGMFYLMCVYAWIRGGRAWSGERGAGSRGRESVVRGPWSAVGWYGVAAAAFVLGMGSKETMITVPVVLLAYDHVFNSGAVASALWRRRWPVLVLALGCMVAAAPFVRVLQAIAGAHNDLFSRIPPLLYLASQPGVILYYLRLSVFPHPLCLDYAWPPVERALDVVLPGGVVTVLLIAALWAAWRRRPVGFLGVWFFVALAPASSIVPFEDIAFEHRMYLPLAAVIVFVSMSVYRLLRVAVARGLVGRRAMSVLAATVVAVALGLLTTMTIARNETYSSEYSMWRDVLSKRPNNVRARFAVIGLLFERGEYANAETMAKELIRRVEAGGRTIDNDRIRAASDDYYYPMVLNRLGQIAMAQSRAEEAIEWYRRSIAARVDDPSTYCNMAVAQYFAGRKDEAVATCRQSLGIAPGYARGHAFLGFLLAERGEYGSAVRHYERAMEYGPGLLSPKCDLAWLLATCPSAGIRDGKRALSLAESVNELTAGKSYRALDLVAAALAECGRFDEAAQVAARAFDIAGGSAPQDGGDGGGLHVVTAEAIGRRLELYREGKPFRFERAGSDAL